MKDIIQEIKKCNVSYHILGKSDRSAMPLGNGELCVSVWVNEAGEICFYISRTDALTELDRTVKLGMVKVDLQPNPFTGGTFVQTLDVADGYIYFEGAGAKLRLCIPPGDDQIVLLGNFEEKTTVAASYITWRTEKKTLGGEFYAGNRYRAFETPDTVRYEENGILFYHQNGETVVKETAALQEVPADILPDLLTGRIFGGYMTMPGEVLKENSIVKEKTEEFVLQIATASMQADETEFEKKLRESVSGEKTDECLRKCKAYWNAYWENSYIIVENDEPAEAETKETLKTEAGEPNEYKIECRSPVTAAYVLTRFMMKCCANGKMPILYNGMLFNLCPGKDQHYNTRSFGETCTAMPEELTIDHNPDERSWCIENLWQNVRHPYHTFLAQGETEALKVLFSYYRRFWDVNRYRAKRYYGAEGQHNTEMTLSFGLQSNSIYGEDREGMKTGYAKNRHGGAVDISPGLELLSMMLDYYEYTKDRVFFKEEIEIYAKELFRYVETRFPEREHGKMKLEPLHSIETYHDTKNPITVVAGLRNNAERLLAMEDLGGEERKYFEDYMQKIPEITTAEEDGQVYLKAAEELLTGRMNVEIPELYACFPFRLYDQISDRDGIMHRTFLKRTREYECDRCFRIGEQPDYPSYSGWQYQGIVAARLGMTELAQKILCENVQLRNPGNRFPAMWGPIYDGVPDTDHGANIVHLLQEMVMQVKDGKPRFLTAFPKEWNVVFRLHVDAQTVAEGEFRDGEWVFLH